MIDRSSRNGVKLSHLHRCHRLTGGSSWGQIFVFTVVQGHSLPCHWAHAYTLWPNGNKPLSRHLSFDCQELEAYRQLHLDQSLRWMDSEFMFQLALDQMQRLISSLLPAEQGALAPVERIDDSQLIRHYINGDLPQLDQLLQACGEHFLLHRQLQALKALPQLRSQTNEQDIQSWA